MTDFTTFANGGALYPLTSSTSNSLLQDADPSAFHALAFWTAMINQYLGARLTAEATAIGHTRIASDGPVAMQLPHDPVPYLLDAHVKLPLLAIARDTFESTMRTASLPEMVWTWQVSFILPPLSAAQAERLQPVLKAVGDVIERTTLRGWDPSYTPPGGAQGDRVWLAAGIDRIDIKNGRIGGYEGADGIFMPCWSCTVTVAERANPVAGNAFVSADLIENLRGQDGTTITDFVDVNSDALALTNLIPTHGVLAGQPVALIGTGFTAAATITFGSNAATRVTLVNGQTLMCQSPASTTSGTKTVTVTVGGSSATFPFVYDSSAPTIATVTPNHLPSTVGGNVTVTGSGFLGATVTVGGNAVTNLNINGGGDTATFTVGAAAAGSAPIVITVAGQSATNAFTLDAPPQVSTVSPNHSPATIAGTTLTFTTVNVLAGATLAIGGTSVTPTITGGGTQVTCTSPTHASGAVSAVITNPDGQAASTSFTFDAAPTVGTPTPTSLGATLGGSVVIPGTGFVSGCTVTFGGSAGTITSFSSTSLTVTAPTHSAGSAAIVVTNPDGQNATTAFSYSAAPTFTSITPNPLAPLSTTPGTVILGTGFVATPTVTIGGNAVSSLVVNSSTSLTMTAPTHAAGTGLPVIITNPDSQSVTGSVDYTFNPGQIADVGWLRADTGVTIGTGVSQWTGGGLTMAQATGSAQPTVLTGGSGINGQSCIHFDSAASQYLSASKSITSSELSFWIVWRCYDVGADSLFTVYKTGDSTDYGNAHGFTMISNQSGTTRLVYQSTNAAGHPPPAIADIVSTVGRFDATNGSRMRKNGTDGSSNALVQSIATDTLYLACAARPSPTIFMKVDIAELAIATHAWSSTELASLSTYATARYGVGA